MVGALGPGRFYGGGLPRPRVFPGDRADPPGLFSWAREAQWSVGGRGGKRLRHQGRIDGSLFRIRRADALGSDDDDNEEEEVVAVAAQEREVFDEDKESGQSEQDEEVALLTPARSSLTKKKTVAEASAPAAEMPVKASLKRKAAAEAGLTSRSAPKRKAAEAPAAKRTSPRANH